MANATNPDRSYPLRAAPALAVVTLLTSMLVAFIVTGTPFSTVRIVDLAHWSGLELTAFSIEDSWRLLTAQLVHVKWPHMLFNVVCLALVAGLVERRIGAFGTLLIWALIGGTATAISPLGIDPPYDVGVPSCPGLCRLCHHHESPGRAERLAFIRHHRAVRHSCFCD